ncbi:hypothetical protein ZIOFF_055580 [Zingiber officinale]|uniref:THH1/TOM1/TOM3 domain-containing protein n=1 Tax=Zingiber officinale TaxID=94328 RepID=A0A8J5FF93_ZINOF|nr:hypothetical protein ZIOFF_055580 [Zingiber officinale]
MVSSPALLALRSGTGWSDEVNGSALWQDRIFHTLALLYGLLSAIALVIPLPPFCFNFISRSCALGFRFLILNSGIQLIRIECRVPEFGWTAQKVFYFLNFLVDGVRSLVFAFRRGIEKISPEIIQHILLDFPGLAFFTTYALLVLFWAEIYYQARSVSTDELGPMFCAINTVVYVTQISLWLVLWWKPIQAMIIVSQMLFAGVSLFAAFGFLLYGGSTSLWNRKGAERSCRRSAMLQLYVSSVFYSDVFCFTYLDSNFQMCINAFDRTAELDVLDHPILNFVYYMFVEILPSSSVLFILRKLPPKRDITQYHPIH